MRKSFTTIALVIMMAMGMAFGSCTGKATEKTSSDGDTVSTSEPDSALVLRADQQLNAHQEDIQTLWEMTVGEDKEMANCALAKDYVFLSSEGGKEGLLLAFYKDMKDIDNFDGIPVCEGQELCFQGDAIVIKEKAAEGEKTTYYVQTEREGFNELFTVTEKDGKKTYTNDLDEPYDEKEALGFIEKLGNAEVQPLAGVLKGERKL